MRSLIALVLLGCVLPAFAQAPGDHALPSQQPAQKPSAGKQFSKGGQALQPIPEPPPPPAGFEPDPNTEPQVTIQRRGTETVEEYRMNGRLYMVKVTPSHGHAYYLIDNVGRGEFQRYDAFDTGTRPPMWVIHQW